MGQTDYPWLSPMPSMSKFILQHPLNLFSKILPMWLYEFLMDPNLVQIGHFAPYRYPS